MNSLTIGKVELEPVKTETETETTVVSESK